MTNRDLVVTQAVDKFKENLKWVLIDGASMLDVEELRKACREVADDTFRFLSASPSPRID